MKRTGKILCLLLALLMIVAGALAWWQWDNLKILLQAGKFSTGELEAQMDENQRALQDMLSGISVREPTGEELEALKNGTLTPEELAKELVEAPNPEDPFSAGLSALIARVLLLQKLYVGKLEGLEAEAKAEYRTLPEEARAKSKLVKWAGGYIKRATQMEKECDAQIDEIIDEMLDLIKKNDGDTEIAKKVAFAYAEEKRLKKAWYLSRLEEGGLLG